MSNFTDGKPRIATEKNCLAPWFGYAKGAAFACGFCGHKFKPGDQWRWVYTGGHTPDGGNALVCKKCDDEDSVLIKLRQDALKLMKRFHSSHKLMGLAVIAVKLQSELRDARELLEKETKT